MMATFDGEPVPVTADMVAALVAWMRAECAMMREHEPRFADCWTWGRCTVGDLSSSTGGLRFEYGGDEDRPDDGLGDFAVVVSVAQLAAAIANARNTARYG